MITSWAIPFLLRPGEVTIAEGVLQDLQGFGDLQASLLPSYYGVESRQVMQM